MRFVIMADANYADVAAMCAESVKHHHPDATLVQLTDAKSPKFDWADDVWRCTGRYPGKWYSLEFVALLAEMDATATAVIGSDTLVCQPMDDVWREDFDIALTWRPAMPDMPYNLGISFCRKPGFFAGVLARMTATAEGCKWMGDQVAVAREAHCGKWKLRVLQCSEWNNSDLNATVIPGARMLHYKGERKQYMAKHYERGIWK